MPDYSCHHGSTPPSQLRGFGLIELVTTIALVAILAAIALPSFASLIRDKRVSTETNDFLTAFNLARNESISRSRGVSICAADTRSGVPAACATSADWDLGWMVFVDDTATPADAPPTTILEADIIRTWVGNEHNELTPGDDTKFFVRFNPRGLSNLASDLTFTLAPEDNCSNQQQREIVVNALGRSKSTKVDCT